MALHLRQCQAFCHSFCGNFVFFLFGVGSCICLNRNRILWRTGCLKVWSVDHLRQNHLRYFLKAYFNATLDHFWSQIHKVFILNKHFKWFTSRINSRTNALKSLHFSGKNHSSFMENQWIHIASSFFIVEDQLLIFIMISYWIFVTAARTLYFFSKEQVTSLASIYMSK